MDEKVAATQKNKQQEMQERHNFEVLKQYDKEENIRRIAKMQEYHRQKIFEKIMKDTEKANRIT
mgnify:CR=1 FL=1